MQMILRLGFHCAPRPALDTLLRGRLFSPPRSSFSAALKTMTFDYCEEYNRPWKSAGERLLSCSERRKVEEPVRSGENMLTKQADDKWRNISHRAAIAIPILSVRLFLDLPVNPFGCMCSIALSLIMKIVMK